MWRKIQSVIAFLCIVVYVGAAVSAIVQIHSGIKSQAARSAKEFDELKDFTIRASVLGFLNKQFQDDVRNYFSMSKTIQGVIINGPSGTHFEVEKMPGTITYDSEYPRFKQQLRLAKEPYSERLNIEGVPAASISAISSIMDYNTLLYILRTSLLAILVAAIVSFSTLILDIAFVRGNNKNYDIDQSDDEETDAGSAYDRVADDGATAADEVKSSDANVDDDFEEWTGDEGKEKEKKFDDLFNFDDNDDGDEKIRIDNFDFDMDAEESNDEELEKFINLDDEIIADGSEVDGESEIEGESEIDKPIIVRKEEIIEPIIDEPVIDESIIDESSIDEPSIDEPIIDEPTIDEDKEEETDIKKGNYNFDKISLFSQENEETPFDDLVTNEPLSFEDLTKDFNDMSSDDISSDLDETFIDSDLSDDKKEGLLAAARKLNFDSESLIDDYDDDDDADDDEEDEDDGTIENVLLQALRRAEAEDTDVSLICIEAEKPIGNYNKLMDIGKSFFKPGTQFVKKFDGGFYVVVHSTTIDESFVLAKEYQRLCCCEYSGNSFSEIAPEMTNTFLVGIAARSKRDITFARLLTEGEHALQKAREDISLPIVAFKVDAEKYKKFESKS